jgi:hypothetical protein
MRHTLSALVAALLLVSCGPDEVPTDETPAPMPARADDDTCGPEQHPALQSGGHLLPGEDAPVPYSSTPPTSGWHASRHPDRGVHEAPLSEPEQVSVLEDGGVVLAWTALPAAERERLEEFAAQHAETVASTPYDELGAGQVAMTAWGVLRVCDGVDLAMIETFVAEHAGAGAPH